MLIPRYQNTQKRQQDKKQGIMDKQNIQKTTTKSQL